MKGAVLTVLCAVALTHATVVINQNGCPEDFSIEKLLPHTNCGQYYQCVHGVPVEKFCRTGLHFNPESNGCDFPAVAKCNSKITHPESETNTVAGHDDPSLAPTICAEKDSDGVLVAHEQCDRFYKCSFGLPVAMVCRDGLLYDPSQERCEWPETVKCGDRVILDNDDNSGGDWIDVGGAGNDDPKQAAAICAAEGSNNVYVAHENCNQFYQCWDGQPIAVRCPVGFLFNPSKDYCDFPNNVNCGDRVIPEIDDSINDNNDGGNEKVEDEPIGNNHDDPSKAPEICGTEGSDGVLVAHENCNQFYKCTFGSPVALICSGDLLFDPTKDRCEWRNTVNCGNRVIPEVNENDNGGGHWEGNGANNDDPSQAPAICAAEGSDHMYVAHENCDQFYQCWAGLPVALVCPAGFLFNPKKDYCDFPYNVECGDRVIRDIIDDSKDNINDANDKDDIPVGNNHDDPSKAPEICGAAGSDGVLVAHENCNQFYKCAFGSPVALICSGDLLFDPTKDRCEWRNTVNCGNRVIPEVNENDNGGGHWEGNGANNDDPSQAPAICAAEGSDNMYVAHENCDQFYQCWAGLPVALVCPAGFLFNPKKDYCDFPYNVECGDRLIRDIIDDSNDNNNDAINEDDVPVGNNHDDPSKAPEICGTAGSDGVLVAHENCNQFYKCTFGSPVALICSGDLLFDPTKDRCEWRHTVNCGNRVIPEVNDNDNGGSQWEGNGANNDDPSLAPAICAAEGSDHIHVAHENCNQFYQCWAGQPVAMNCQPNTYFNPKKDYCDFLANVDCSNRVI